MAARIDILSLDSIKSIIHDIISGRTLRESSLLELYNIVKEKNPSLIGKQIIDADIKQILTSMQAEAVAQEAKTIITENIEKLERKLKDKYPEHQVSNKQLKANLSKLNITVLREIKQFLASKRIYFGHEIMEKIIPGFKKREEELIREQEEKENFIKESLIPKIKKTYPNYDYTKNKNQNENQLKRNLEKLDTVRLLQIDKTLEKGIELDHATQHLIFRGFSQSQYKTKYLKYKMKYLELKKKINSYQL